MTRAGIVLAAGQGTRMKSAMPKVMHKIAGLPILGHVIAAMKGAGVSRIVVVAAPDAESVREFCHARDVQTVVQDRQLGTGHAAACARTALEGFDGTLIVTYGDHPLFTSATFESSFAARKDGLALVAFKPRDPAMYGRVMQDGDGFVARMVEFKDATEKELANPERAMQERLRRRALDAGAGMTAPETVYLSHDTVLEPDVLIGPYVVFGPSVTIRAGAEIKAFS